MNCPNFNTESVRDEFNKLVIAAGGEPLTIEEFKNKDLRNKRSGVDDLAMQIAYRKYDSNTNPDAQDEVLLERTTPPGINNESGILPLEANRELYKSLGLIDKNGVDIKVWSYKVWGQNPASILEKVLAKKNNRSDIRDRYEFILKNHPNGLGYAIWLRAKNVDPLTSGQIGMFQRESITHNVISGAKKSFSFNALRNSVKKIIVSIANEMSSRFGIAFSIIGQVS